jgi:hypothetical protein
MLRLLMADKTMADARTSISNYDLTGNTGRYWVFQHAHTYPALARSGQPTMPGDSGYVHAGWREYLLSAAIRERFSQ